MFSATVELASFRELFRIGKAFGYLHLIAEVLLPLERQSARSRNQYLRSPVGMPPLWPKKQVTAVLCHPLEPFGALAIIPGNPRLANLEFVGGRAPGQQRHPLPVEDSHLMSKNRPPRAPPPNNAVPGKAC